MYFKDRLPDSVIQQEGTALGSLFGSPIYVDSSDSNNVYLGYCNVNKALDKDSECLVVKIVISNNIVTKYFAYGAWANRASLQYK